MAARRVAEVQEVAMSTLIDSERRNRIVWTVLGAVGAVLCLVGWYRWAM